MGTVRPWDDDNFNLDTGTNTTRNSFITDQPPLDPDDMSNSTLSSVGGGDKSADDQFLQDIDDAIQEQARQARRQYDIDIKKAKANNQNPNSIPPPKTAEEIGQDLLQQKREGKLSASKERSLKCYKKKSACCNFSPDKCGRWWPCIKGKEWVQECCQKVWSNPRKAELLAKAKQAIQALGQGKVPTREQQNALRSVGGVGNVYAIEDRCGGGSSGPNGTVVRNDRKTSADFFKARQIFKEKIISACNITVITVYTPPGGWPPCAFPWYLTGSGAPGSLPGAINCASLVWPHNTLIIIQDGASASVNIQERINRFKLKVCCPDNENCT